MEKQFRRYYAEAASRPGRTGETLPQILESRLDNVVYRVGLARTRSASRKLVTHGHFLVNGQRVDVPSYRVEQYDIITVRKQSTDCSRSNWLVRPSAIARFPRWMKVVPESLTILIHSLPVRQQIDSQVAEQLIVEFYSK